MNVERDIAGITLPFILGVSVAVFSSSIITKYIHPVAVISLILCLLLAIILLSDISGMGRFIPRWAAVAGSLAFCGVFIGCSELLLAVSEAEAGGALSRAALGIREQLEASIMRLPFRSPETNNIVNALITGDKSGIHPGVKEAFRASGASHILALSGLHLGIIYGIIRKSLFIIGNSPSAKIIKSVITIATCSLYTLATGAGPSIVRALLFIIIGETALLTHRKASLKTILLISMLIQLIIEPSAIKEVGFQLSYAAVAGIAWIFPYLKGFWPGNSHEDNFMIRGLRWIWNSAALSISCQITTGPLAYFYFQSFPTHFILTNLIALPLTGLIIPASLLTLLASGLGWCPDILIRATEMLVTALSEALHVISVM